jgi:O-antigen ligase
MAGTAVFLPWLFPQLWRAGRTACGFLALLGAQAVSVALSTAFSTRSALSLWGSNWRSLGLVTNLTLILFTLVTFAWCRGSELRVRQLLRGIVVAGSLAAVYGILQYFGIDPWQAARAYQAGEGIFTIVRPPGTLGHADYFAAWLLFVLFAGIALASNDSSRWRIFCSVAAGLAAAALVLTGTRGAAVGAAAAALFLLVRLRPRVSRRARTACACLAAAALAFYFSPAGDKLRSRMHWIGEDTGGGARLLLWRDSLRLAQQHWLLGAGPDTFSAEFPPYQSKELAQAYPDYYYESPHNLLLDALTTQGSLGLAVLIGLIAFGMWAGRTRKGDAPYLLAALIGCVVAQMFTVMILATALYFYLTVAMLAALRSEPATAPSGVRRWMAVPVSAVLLFFALRMLLADRTLELARRNLEARNIRDALGQYREARAGGVSADLWYARSLVADAPYEALDAARRALAGEDAQNAAYTVAWIHAREGDLAQTERALRETLRCAPNWYKPHWMLSQVLARQGRSEEARSEAALAAELNAGKNPAVARSTQPLTDPSRGSKSFVNSREQGPFPNRPLRR